MKTIYAICDSKTNDVMYVGQTGQLLRKRISLHKSCVTLYKHDYPIYEWMRNNEYYGKTLVVVEDWMATETENKCMELYKDTILNINFMNKLSEAAKAKHRGRKHSEETRAKIAAAVSKTKRRIK